MNATVNCTDSLLANCTYFDLLSTAVTEFVEFRVKSHYENEVYHLSPVASISVAELFISTSNSNSTNALAAKGIFPFTQLVDLP